MNFLFTPQLDKRKSADGLVLPFWKGKKQGEWAIDHRFHSPQLDLLLEAGDFKGKEGEVALLYVDKQPEKRIILLGLGPKEKISVEGLRRSYGSLTKTSLGKKLTSLNVVIPQGIKGLNEELLITGMAEGLLLPNYIFSGLKKQDQEDERILLKKINWIGSSKHTSKIAEKVLNVCEAIYAARDLVNGNADEITPQYLSRYALSLASDNPSLKVTVFNKKRIEKEKMGLLLAVNRGSDLDPAFILVEYKGNPKSKDHTVVVGKGITYDTGGLNIKVSGMEYMKCDMGGAATCLGLMMAIARLKLKVNVTAVIPTTENSVDAKSFKPGDVYIGYSGKTVEMTNSDAEGRLVLADALAYACRNLKPTRLIDFATLTGAIDIALGSEATGLMSNQGELAEALKEAGEVTGERVWRMPLYEEYKDKLKSDIADLKSWNGRSASSSVAATFLHAFVDEGLPWAHLDIASTAYLSEPKKYQPKYGTGVGIRLMIEFLENLHPK